jgi:ketosteroid isomerase-like protein
MVLIRFRFTVRASGREASMQIHHYWRFRDGQVEQWRGSEDTEQTVAVLA